MSHIKKIVPFLSPLPWRHDEDSLLLEDARGEIIGHISDSSEGKAIAARVNGWDALVAERDLLKEQVKLLREALLEIAGTSANENSEPDRMADALGEIQGIVHRALEATKEGA